MNHNQNHPELKSEEIFLMNVKKDEDFSGALNNDSIESVRIGNNAYSNVGEVVEGYVPLFGKLKDKSEN